MLYPSLSYRVRLDYNRYPDSMAIMNHPHVI